MVATIKVELGDFIRSSKKHIGNEWPKAVTKAFGGIAGRAMESAQQLTREKFKLHGDYVLRGIRHYPANAIQEEAAAHALKRYGDMNAAVYLRGANDPKRSLGFMAHHEYGEERQAHSPWVSLNGDRYIAVPLDDLLKKSAKTSGGRIRKRLRPSDLLERFSQSGSRFDGNTTINKGVKYRPRNAKKKGAAFIIASAKRHIPMIAQASHGGLFLEFLYALVPDSKIREQWGFVKRVYKTVDEVAFREIKARVFRMENNK